MALRFPCPTCNRELSGPESIHGTEVQCPSCRTVFVAGARHRPEGAGIRPAHVPLTAAPPADVANPFRKSASDDDAPPDVRVAERRPYPRRGLLLFLVLTVVGATFGVTALLLMGRPTATSAPAVRLVKPTAWPPFRVPNTSVTVSLPDKPDAEPERTVEDAVVNRYRVEDDGRPTRNLVFEVVTIRTRRVQVDDERFADWVTRQLRTKLNLTLDNLEDEEVMRELGEAQGRRWRAHLANTDDPAMVKVYLMHDGNSSTLVVFLVAGPGVARNNAAVSRFLDSVQRTDDLPQGQN
jgi:hypothetical protein